ncbi:MAG: TIGR04084 family radical SAM/SPASM domain-containing protein [Promethearchaeota archaeon]
MIFNIQLTLHCNLNCSYCQATVEDSFFPPRINYSLKTLKSFIKKDPNAIIAFYGGEPLLELPLIKKIMDNINVQCYILQTNGLLLHKVPPDYLRRFHTILLSIDGREFITDLHRGKGTYKKVLENARLIRRRRFKGELIARMTVTKEMNIYPEVIWLLQLENPQFDSVHWQIDLMFNDRALWNNMEYDWITLRYNPQITKLVSYWVKIMKKESKVLKIYPFLGVLDRIFFNKTSKLHCGAGWIWQNICTNGIIAACPVGADFKEFHIGHISNTHPLDTFDALSIGNPCPTCKIFEICSGRCLYANIFKPWGFEGYQLACKTVFHLVNELQKVQPEIKKMLLSQKMSLNDFKYLKYNCCEIIP